MRILPSADWSAAPCIRENLERAPGKRQQHPAVPKGIGWEGVAEEARLAFAEISKELTFTGDPSARPRSVRNRPT